LTELYASDLDDDTAFERLFLATAFPLADTAAWEAAGSYDVVTDLAQVQISVHEYLGTTPESAVALLGIQPLAFGASWKALDILLEYALAAAGYGPKNARRWTIAEKVAKARQGLGRAEPLTNDQTVWRALLHVYAETEQVRHSLVHRRVTKRQDGALVGTNAQGSPLPGLTLAEQEACCSVVQRAVDAVIRGSISPRERSDLAWNLDRLSAVHRQALIGGRQVTAVRRFAVNVSAELGRFEIDGTHLKQRLAQTTTGQWIEVHFQAGAEGSLLADLDDIPDGQQSVSLTAPPNWARRP
jgi:hypothetical protein